MNVEQARFNMIEQQVRPWDVLDTDVLDLLMTIKREEFVPATYRDLAFADMEVPLGSDAVMMAPKIEARVLQELRLRKSDKVLEIGTGSGYMAALMAAKAGHVTTVEIVPQLAEQARANLRKAGINNVTVETGNGAEGLPAQAPFDVIVVSGGMLDVPKLLLEQLRVGGRLMAFVGEAPVQSAQLVVCIEPGRFRTTNVFETLVPMLNRVPSRSRFEF